MSTRSGKSIDRHNAVMDQVGAPTEAGCMARQQTVPEQAVATLQNFGSVQDRMERLLDQLRGPAPTSNRAGLADANLGVIPQLADAVVYARGVHDEVHVMLSELEEMLCPK